MGSKRLLDAAIARAQHQQAARTAIPIRTLGEAGIHDAFAHHEAAFLQRQAALWAEEPGAPFKTRVSELIEHDDAPRPHRHARRAAC